MRPQILFCRFSVLLLAANFIFSAIGMAQESESTTAPKINTFALDPDARGALGNSVNLFTGDVNFPLNLVTLPGKNGLDVNVAISYNSNVQNIVDTWNVAAPTGILGLGWAMDYEKIIVDHKNTGSRFDDDFYLIAGGASTLLVRTGAATDTIYQYKTKNYQLWKILFYPTDERWEIIRENGVKYVYGGSIGFDGNGQRTSVRNTVQWGVKWGNWIGSSSVTTGQSQFAIAWNLSKIENTWGDNITFEYDLVEQYAGSTSGKKHTVASYLKKITDAFGRVVEFYYQEKSYSGTGPREYQAAHNEHGATGVYQDKYETRYLQYLAVFKAGGTDTLSTTHLGYHALQYLNGNDDLAKRYLKSITQYISGRKTSPALVFDYYLNSATDTHYGALKTIKYPQGGTATYSYAAQTITKSERSQLSITGPSKPRVWMAEDYVVVTWFRSPNYVDIYAYHWDGRWIASGLLGTLGGVSLLGNQQDFEIFVERDFFAVVEKYYSNTYDKVVHLFHKHPYKSGNWVSYNSSNYMGSIEQRAFIGLGRNFAAIFSRHSGNLNKYHWNELTMSWSETGVIDQNPGFGGNNGCAAAGTNYFLISYPPDNGSSNHIFKWHFLDELNQWQASQLPNALSFNPLFGDIGWYAGASFVFALHPSGQNIYRWDEYFTPSQFALDSFTGVNTNARVGIYESTISLNSLDVGMEVKGMRWNGAAWKSQFFNSSLNYTSSAAGHDFIVRRDLNDGSIKRYVFDPNLDNWVEHASAGVTGLYGPLPVAISFNAYGWYTNTEGQNPQAKLHHRLPNATDGWGAPTAISGWGAGELRLSLGNDFYVYEDWYLSGGGSTFSNSKIGLFKNGQWNSTAGILDDYFLPASTEQLFTYSIVTRNQTSWDSSTQLRLYRVVDDSHTGPLIDLAVSSVAIFDGYETVTTSYQYNAAKAIFDPSGNVAQYNEVTVTPGSGSNGYTKHYFINGLPSAELAAPYPSNDAYTNVDSFYSHVRGLEYKTDAYNSGNAVVSTSTKYWKVFHRWLRANEEGTYVRLMKESSTVDGVENIVENTYNTLGLTTETKTYNYNWDGNLDTHTQTFKYWHEAYDPTLSLNLLTPVIQTTTQTNSTVTSVTATTWKEWFTAKWAPHKSYQWNGTGVSSFDFANWSGTGEPSTGWLKTSEAVTMITEGAVLQTKDVDGVYQSTLYDYPKLRPIAAFSNARISQSYIGSEASFINFEHGSATSNARENDYWEFPALNAISAIAHTGRKSVSLGADNNSSAAVYGPTRDFRPPDLGGQQRQYVLSCWVRTQAGFGANKGQLIIHSKQDNDTNHSTYPNVTGAYIAVNFSDTQGQWQYLEAYLNLKQVRADGAVPDNTLLRLRCYPVNDDDTHYVLVDDLRLSPVDAPFSATVYDPDYDLATAAIGANGETVRSVYDNFQRPIATVGPNENVTSVSAPYYSRSGNNDNFSTTDPNSALSAATRNGGVFDDFNDGDANGWNLSDGNWTITSDGKLKNTGVDASDNAVLSNFSYANYGVRAQVKHLSGAANFGIKIGNILVQWIGKWELRDGGTFVKDETVTPLTDNWLLITSDKTVLFFADGKLIFKEIRPATISGQLKLFTGAAGTQVTFDDVLVFRDAVLSRNFLDGAGKVRQAQTLNGLKYRISETVYDALGRPAVQTKTAEFTDDSSFVFQPGFVGGPNWSTGVMTGRVAEYYSLSGSGYSNDNGYPYTRQVYENSPLGRVVESGLPGQTFAVGQEHSAWAQYSNNIDGNFVGTTLASGSLPVGQYFVKTDLSPDGVYSYTLTDKAGNLIAEKIDSNGGIDPTTSHEYDDFGRLIRTRLPNYYNPPAGGGTWTNSYLYDFFGHITQKTTPDAPVPFFYIYDKAGRLRFMMDANGWAQNPDHIQYWKYDALGRAIECGYLAQDWNDIVLQSYADTNPSWPSTPVTWRKKYTHDYNGTTPYLKGRLYKVETNNDGDTAAEVEETFAYDIYGNVVNKTAKVLDYNASSYGIAYEYDHGGNVTRMTYIPASMVLQNETVTGVLSYSAVDSITAGPAYTVASGASAVLQAGKRVILKPGFAALQGSYFNAKIDPALTTDATVVTYSYDALGKLVSVGTPGDADFYASYTYHADGRLNAEKLANGTETRNHFYNSPGWLLRIDGDRFTEDITHVTGWTGPGYYDGRIKTTSFIYNWSGKPDDYAVQYTYDDLGQLTVADNNLSNAWDIGVANSISYDANGNILDLTRGSTTKNYAYYAGTNKVQNLDGSGNDYVYDSNANVISSSPKSINTIAYDTFTQRPTSVSMSSGASLALEYGGDTQRILKNYTSGGNTNSKLYLHGQNDYPLIERNKTSATAETLAVYIYGANGAIAKRVGSTVLFLLKDHLGSTRVVMDATGLVRTYYDYDALGNLIRTGTVNEVKYQFTGQEYDESGVHNYRARLYDSDLGKFYAVDPAEQGWSPYVYAGNNPVIIVDRDGKLAWFVPLLIGAGLNLVAHYDNLDGGEWLRHPLKTLGFAAVGAATGYLSGFGGGTFLNNVAWGVATGAFHGAGNALVGGADPATIGRKAYQGAVVGGSLAALQSWIEYQRNWQEYGHFKSNDGTLQELVNAGTDENSRMRAIEFVQKRYDLAGYKGMNFHYRADLDKIAGPGTLGLTEPSGRIYLSDLAFVSGKQLRETMLHEVGHQLYDRAINESGQLIRIEYPNTEEFLFGHGWNADNLVARYAGKLHIGPQPSQYSRFLEWYFAIGRRW